MSTKSCAELAVWEMDGAQLGYVVLDSKTGDCLEIVARECGEDWADVAVRASKVCDMAHRSLFLAELRRELAENAKGFKLHLVSDTGTRFQPSAIKQRPRLRLVNT